MKAVPYVSRHHIGVYMAKQLHQREHNTAENERSPLCEQASYRCIHGTHDRSIIEMNFSLVHSPCGEMRSL